jgi:predicted phosphodiesterase
MKLAILSDIHSNLEALRATLDHATTSGAGRVLCLGDIVGYNTNPNECIALLREHDAICVAGNHDRAVTGQITTEGFSGIAARGIAWTQAHIGTEERDYLAGLPGKALFDNTLVMVHGALHPETGSELVYLDNDEQRRLSFHALAAHASGARICAFGHTHRAGIFERRGDSVRQIEADVASLREDACYLINPGTVGQPRTGDQRATYFMFDTAQRQLALQHVDYDAAAAFTKTRGAGLGPPLGFLSGGLRTRLIRGVRAAGLYDVLKRAVR